jgi:hypothetical protein
MNVLKVQKAILIGSYYDDIRFWSDTIQNIIIKNIVETYQMSMRAIRKY